MYVSELEAEARLAADPAGISHSEPDVAVLAPAHSPGILDPPGLAGEADQVGVVVDLGAAVLQDSGTIELPVGGVDGHC